jgi:hypothetical protein
LTSDVYFLVLGLFLLCIFESSKITDPSDRAFEVFPMIFEVTSAYGNVGMSLGHPKGNTPLTAEFCSKSKVVVCILMIRGRHRLLPLWEDSALVCGQAQHAEPILLDNQSTTSEGTSGIKDVTCIVGIEPIATSAV